MSPERVAEQINYPRSCPLPFSALHCFQASWPAGYFPVPSGVPEPVLHALANESIKEVSGSFQVAKRNRTSSCAGVCYHSLSYSSCFPHSCRSVWHSLPMAAGGRVNFELLRTQVMHVSKPKAGGRIASGSSESFSLTVPRNALGV